MKTMLFIYAPTTKISEEEFTKALTRFHKALKPKNDFPLFMIEENPDTKTIGVKVINGDWRTRMIISGENRLWNLKVAGFKLQGVFVSYQNAVVPSFLQRHKKPNMMDVEFSDLSQGLPINHLFMSKKRNIIISIESLDQKNRQKHRRVFSDILDELERKIILTETISAVAEAEKGDKDYPEKLKRLYLSVHLISKRRFSS